MVIEDNAYLSEAYIALHCDRIRVIQFNNINDAEVGLEKISPTFILLDFDIRGANSLLEIVLHSFCRTRPFIIAAVSHFNRPARIAALRKGADACVEKPVNVDEVQAVIEAAQRRKQWDTRLLSDDQKFQIKHRELTIDTLRRRVTMRGALVALTRKEYDVLCVLANHGGAVMTKEEIHTAVWKTKYNPKGTNVSDQISSLRRKLGLSSKDTNYIHTVIGVGYRFGTHM